MAAETRVVNSHLHIPWLHVERTYKRSSNALRPPAFLVFLKNNQHRNGRSSLPWPTYSWNGPYWISPVSQVEANYGNRMTKHWILGSVFWKKTHGTIDTEYTYIHYIYIYLHISLYIYTYIIIYICIYIYILCIDRHVESCWSFRVSASSTGSSSAGYVVPGEASRGKTVET